MSGGHQMPKHETRNIIQSGTGIWPVNVILQIKIFYQKIL